MVRGSPDTVHDAPNTYMLVCIIESNMSTTHDLDEDEDDVEDEPPLGTGETLEERLDRVDVDEDETCTTDELRDRLDL